MKRKAMIEVLDNNFKSVRVCVCPCCGVEIAAGEAHVKYATPKNANGRHAHKKCFKNMGVWKEADRLNQSKEYESNAKKHRIVVYGLPDDVAYFNGENEFTAERVSPTVYKFTSKEYNNRRAIATVVTMCFRHGYRVWVDLVEEDICEEVKSKEDYLKLTNDNFVRFYCDDSFNMFN